MYQLTIADLNFIEIDPYNKRSIKGGITPTISTDVATAVDTRVTTFASIEGDLASGFKINQRARGSSASAAASAVSLGGKAKAFAFADAG